jgi:hypothetical protein
MSPMSSSRATRMLLWIGAACLAASAAYLLAELRANAARDGASARDRAELHREMDTARESRRQIRELMESVQKDAAEGRSRADEAARRAQEALDRLARERP